MFAKVNKPTVVFLKIGILLLKKKRKRKRRKGRKDLIHINLEMHLADGYFDNTDIKK